MKHVSDFHSWRHYPRALSSDVMIFTSIEISLRGPKKEIKEKNSSYTSCFLDDLSFSCSERSNDTDGSK